MNVRGISTLAVSVTRLIAAIRFRTSTTTNMDARMAIARQVKPYNRVYQDFPSPVQAHNWDLVWVQARHDSIR
ncbi:MAG TPA: hypothetical protein VFE98_06230 [Candidatus Bathyarchaeia archaeon]|nr:hypothetical protein [Candidatus Bathyarchaeia archaeon]